MSLNECARRLPAQLEVLRTLSRTTHGNTHIRRANIVSGELVVVEDAKLNLAERGDPREERLCFFIHIVVTEPLDDRALLRLQWRGDALDRNAIAHNARKV